MELHEVIALIVIALIGYFLVSSHNKIGKLENYRDELLNGNKSLVEENHELEKKVKKLEKN